MANVSVQVTNAPISYGRTSSPATAGSGIIKAPAPSKLMTAHIGGSHERKSTKARRGAPICTSRTSEVRAAPTWLASTPLRAKARRGSTRAHAVAMTPILLTIRACRPTMWSLLILRLETGTIGSAMSRTPAGTRNCGTSTVWEIGCQIGKSGHIGSPKGIPFLAPFRQCARLLTIGYSSFRIALYTSLETDWPRPNDGTADKDDVGIPRIIAAYDARVRDALFTWHATCRRYVSLFSHLYIGGNAAISRSWLRPTNRGNSMF